MRSFSKLFLLLWILLALNTSFALSQSIPSKPQGYVSDFAHLLPPAQKEEIEILGREIERKTGIEIAVVIVKSIAPESIETYAVHLFEKWGIGKKGKDNGLLILLSLAEKKVRIEVGYGLEGILPDGLCGRIIREIMVPYFRQQKWGEGLLAGSTAIAQIIAKEYGVNISPPSSLSPNAYTLHPSSGRGIVRVVNSLFSLLILFLFLSGRIGFLPFLFLGGLRGGFWSEDSYGGGSFGGGFEGFGGGLSGGGGASGSW